MHFSDEMREYYEDAFDKVKAHVAEIRANPAKFGLVPGERLYIWRRLEELEAMSKEDWMLESEADYTLFGRFMRYMPENDWNCLNKRCEILRKYIEQKHKSFLEIHAKCENKCERGHVPATLSPEDEKFDRKWNYIARYVARLVSLPFAEFMQEFEADDVLLTGTY
jgi:hypothetical protein